MARHQLKPVFDQVVIKELEPDRMRKSDLVVPPGTSEPPLQVQPKVERRSSGDSIPEWG